MNLVGLIYTRGADYLNVSQQRLTQRPPLPNALQVTIHGRPDEAVALARRLNPLR